MIWRFLALQMSVCCFLDNKILCVLIFVISFVLSLHSSITGFDLMWDSPSFYHLWLNKICSIMHECHRSRARTNGFRQMFLIFHWLCVCVCVMGVPVRLFFFRMVFFVSHYCIQKKAISRISLFSIKIYKFGEDSRI